MNIGYVKSSCRVCEKLGTIQSPVALCDLSLSSPPKSTSTTAFFAVRGHIGRQERPPLSGQIAQGYEQNDYPLHHTNFVCFSSVELKNEMKDSKEF